MATSAVPAAINALLTIWRALPGLTGVQVLDGPPTGDQSDTEYVSVGWQPESNDVAAESVQTFNSAGARTRDEDFALTCWVDTWNGDADVGARRARAYELLAVIEESLRATSGNPTAPTLLGTVLFSQMTSSVLRQVNTDQGVRAGIGFSVNCRARI